MRAGAQLPRFLGIANSYQQRSDAEPDFSKGRSRAPIQQGDAAAEIFSVIEADEDMAMLVLAAGSSQEGPGPLVAQLGRTAGTYPIPVVIVPAHLSEDELDALS